MLQVSTRSSSILQVCVFLSPYTRTLTPLEEECWGKRVSTQGLSSCQLRGESTMLVYAPAAPLKGSLRQVPLFLTSNHCPQPLPPHPGNPPAGQAHCMCSGVYGKVSFRNSHCQSSAIRCCLSKCQNGHVNSLSSVLGLSHLNP